jgi:sulfite reductase (NADPH) flavoprotein alpha-component
MSALPLPSPLDEIRQQSLDLLLEGLDSSALHWLSGYTAGLARAAAPQTGRTAVASAVQLSIVYGSQTGNSRRVAEALAREAEAAGIPHRLLGTDAYPTRELAAERLLVVVVSTQGEGDPPDPARDWLEFVHGRRAPKLPQLRYAVLALGDSSYPQFCVIGRSLDARLAELGARRLAPLAEADIDIDTVATPWRADALKHATQALAEVTPAATVTTLRPLTAVARYSREQPFDAPVLQNQRLTAAGSDKDVRHVELSLAGSGLAFQPGDSLGVAVETPAPLVDAVLQLSQLDGDSDVAIGDEQLALREWLLRRRELTRLSRPLLTAHAERSGSSELQQLLQQSDTARLADFFATHQLIDLLRRWPAPWSAEDLVRHLRPMTPRLYSIASSPLAFEDEVHLCVDVVGHEDTDPLRLGTASWQLAQLDESGHARVYIEANNHFRLPADSSRDLVMIGPGTGVAPFRAFLQQRVAEGATGRHWLFFGARRMRSDFLYQTEWQAALKAGQLQRLDLAFSRDGAERVHVQQRLREQGAELHRWLQDGAYLYVCGAIAMGRDVHSTLLQIGVVHGGLSVEAAEAWLTQLQREGRYARDVY